MLFINYPIFDLEVKGLFYTGEVSTLFPKLGYHRLVIILKYYIKMQTFIVKL